MKLWSNPVLTKFIINHGGFPENFWTCSFKDASRGYPLCKDKRLVGSLGLKDIRKDKCLSLRTENGVPEYISHSEGIIRIIASEKSLQVISAIF